MASGTHEVQHPKYSADMLHTMYGLQQRQVFTDFTVNTGGDVFNCHRLVLASASPYFLALLNSGLEESQKAEVRLETIDTNTMKDLIYYMYQGSISLTTDTVEKIFIASDYLHLEDLKQECMKFMHDEINLNLCIPWYRFAKHHSLSQLEEQAHSIMVGEFQSLVRCPAFLEMSFPEIQQLLQNDDLIIPNENVALYGVKIWLQHDQEKREEFFDDIIDEVRFCYCSKPVLESMVVEFGTFLSDAKHSKLSKLAFRPQKSQKPRDYHAIQIPKPVVIGGRIDRNYINETCWKWEEKSASWDEITTLPVKGADFTSICQIPKGLFMSGGIQVQRGHHTAIKQCFLFDASTRNWTEVDEIPKKRHKHASAFCDESVYLIGGKGSNAQESLCSVDAYNISSGQWFQAESMPRSCQSPAVVTNRINIIAFIPPFHTLQFNVLLDKWTELAVMPSEVKKPEAVVIDNTAYVVDKDVFQQFNIDTNTWCVFQPPEVSCKHASVMAYQGGVVVMGGYTDDFEKPSDLIQKYDVALSSWSTEAHKLPKGLRYHFAFVLPSIKA